MKFNLIEAKEILDFEKELGVELTVNERPEADNLPKYHVSFDHVEVMEGGCLCSPRGDGETIDDALRDYCNEIGNRRIALFEYTDKRREVVCPKLVHTKKVRRLSREEEKEKQTKKKGNYLVEAVKKLTGKYYTPPGVLEHIKQEDRAKPNFDSVMETNQEIEIISWNRFPGFYVVSKDQSIFDGLKFHFWAETITECKKWIQENEAHKTK